MQSQDLPRDIWFCSPLRLTEMVDALGADILEEDYENYWEWIIADMDGMVLDITRTHTREPHRTSTRIFVYNLSPMSEATIRKIVAALQKIRINPIYVGQWNFLHDNEFDQIVHEVFDL
ncbi:hypothetical protein [Streptomyces bobili]|uniref:hypothetical protein n=1 Tax=Streptomyces bobili TaxID=67280 RepID=UPI0037F5D5FD